MRHLVKQDINFLDKPLWFQNTESEETGLVWTDLEGYTYRTAYKAPDKVDIIFLYYMLLQVQECGYKTDMEFSRYEILKACNVPTNPQYYQRLNDSLERWTNVSIKFHGTFYDGTDYLSIMFHIIDDFKIKKNEKK